MVSAVLFDVAYQLLQDRIDINGITPITDKEYFDRGSTSLLDVVRKTIQKISNTQKHTSEDLRTDKLYL